MICKKHPKYKGIRKPKIDCLDCFKVYAEKLYEDWFGISEYCRNCGCAENEL